MGVSVILILVMISRKVNNSDIGQKNNKHSTLFESPDPIITDEYSVLDIENNYQEMEEIKYTKNVFKEECNDNSLTTGSNSYNNIYSLSKKNGYDYGDYKKMDNNEIEDFISNNRNEEYDSENNKDSAKVYHKKNQFLII